MRRRKTEEELIEIPDYLDTFRTEDWSEMDVDYAVALWREKRTTWLRSQRLFPLELCLAEEFDGTATEWFDLRDAWEEAHGRDLPSYVGFDVPPEPFDFNEI